MVSVKLMGGIGNNLFQISTLIAYSIKHNFDYRICSKIQWPHYPGQKVYYSNNIKYCDEELVLPMFNEKDFTYTEISAQDNICLFGQWQSYKYFDFCIDEIRNILGFNYEVKNNKVGLHIRRGDFLVYHTIHPTVSEEYILKGINYFKEKNIFHFKVFSDDIDWCKSFIGRIDSDGLDFTFSENKNEVEDFQELLNCEHFLTSNSTFSLMASILNSNPNKIVIHPKEWFGIDGQYNDTRDLYPPQTIIL